MFKKLEKLQKAEIHAGILHDVLNSGTSVIDYAIFNEFGTSTIPARSFLNSSFKENETKYMAKSWKIYEKALSGADVTLDLERLGEEVANDIKVKISSNIPPELKPATIKRKKSSKTLIDSGILRSSITSRVVNV